MFHSFLVLIWKHQKDISKLIDLYSLQLTASNAELLKAFVLLCIEIGFYADIS